MSLYNKASIVLAPGAYKEGRIFNQKPLGESSDLKFDRGTSATEVTRVDNNSVIKESILLGSEVLVNGDFSSDSNWIKSGDVTIGGNNANFISSGDYIQQSITNPSSYRVILNVSSVTTSGAFRIRANNFAETTTITIDSTGEYVIDDPLTSNDGLVLQSDGFIGSISSVSVKQSFRDIPRINYLGDDGGYLLIEHESTNTATYSNDFTQGNIFVGGGTPQLQNSLILSPSQGVSPDGTNNSWKIQVGTTNNVMHHLRFTNAIVTSGVVNTLSVFAKKGENVDYFGIFCDDFDANYRAWFDLENGTKGTLQNGVSSNMEDYGNGWYRCSISFQTTTLTVGNLRLVLAKTDGGSNFIGGTNEYHYIYGVQGEVNAFPTSYIPTSGGTATRAAETAIDAGGDENLFGQTEGVLYVEMAKFENDSSTGQVSISSDSKDNVVSFKAITSNRFQMQLRAGGGSVKTVTSSDNISDNTNFNKYAVSYKSGEIKVFANGSQIGLTGTETFSFSSNIIFLKLNSGNDGNDDFRGKIKCIAVFKETLTNTELQELTS